MINEKNSSKDIKENKDFKNSTQEIERLKSTTHYLDSNAETFELEKELFDKKILPNPSPLSFGEGKEEHVPSATHTTVILQKLYLGIQRLEKE